MHLLASCVWTLLAAGAPATLPPTLPSEHVEVSLAQFDVVVRDPRTGGVVRGLGPRDFAVLEAGEPLEIVAVDEFGGSAAPAPAPTAAAADAVPPPAGPDAPQAPPNRPAQVEPRRFVLVFDRLNGSTAQKLHFAKRAAQEFVRKNLGPTDLAAVYVLDDALRPQVGFSNDAEEIAQAIGRIAWMPGSSFADDVAESVLAYRSRASVDHMGARVQQGAVLEGERLDWTRDHVYRSLGALSGIFGGLDGRRILVLVSPGFPMTTAGDIERERGGFTLQFKDMVRALGQSAITVYTIDAGDDLAFSDASRAIEWRMAVGKLGMEESFLSDVGLEKGLGTATASSRREFLGVVASETGGRMLTSSDFGKSFRTIDEESANFYRISCRVPVGRDPAKYRRILVRARDGKLEVAARRGRYGDIYPSSGRPKGEAPSAKERLDRYRPLASAVRATPLPASADGSIPVVVVAEVAGPVEFHTLPDGSAEIALDFLAVARVEGEVVGRHERRLTAKVRPEGLPRLRQGFRVEGWVRVPVGIYELQTTVRLESPAQLATWSGPMTVAPNPHPGRFRFSNGFFSAEDGGAKPLLMAQEGVPDDPLTLAEGVRILPSVTPEATAGTRALVLFWLGDGTTPQGPPGIRFEVAAIDSGDRAAPLDAKLVSFRPAAAGYRGALDLDLRDLAEGAWRLRIVATRADGAAADLTLPFSVSGPAVTSPAR